MNAGDAANLAAPASVSFHSAVFLPDFDPDTGDAISGTERWRIDYDYPVTIKADDPSLSSWGTAPSGSLALDARNDYVLMSFATPTFVESFKATLDNSTFGTLFTQDVLVYGAGNTVIASQSIDQTVPGLLVDLAINAEVSSILLPSSAFYDDLTVIPEPSTYAANAGLVSLALALRRRLTA
ncbi:MAG: hypothetical protein SFV32_05970 [Opitutaceae bacterium]|nr:hypothetical protein [Opitutaceae bacterium]